MFVTRFAIVSGGERIQATTDAEAACPRRAGRGQNPEAKMCCGCLAPAEPEMADGKRFFTHHHAGQGKGGEGWASPDPHPQPALPSPGEQPFLPPDLGLAQRGELGAARTETRSRRYKKRPRLRVFDGRARRPLREVQRGSAGRCAGRPQGEARRRLRAPRSERRELLAPACLCRPTARRLGHKSDTLI